ncbi:MAG: alpha/beta hydrolase [Bacteroidales bacterium]|jgi:pimeloyl-ACP methyl ester carboxylesterase|nr:alpha/beta hydrolase [Bacteroidales bacterium]
MDRFFEFESGKIHFTDQGRGDVIILVHGYLETCEIWRSFGRRLSSQYRVLAVDLPGHGKSDMLGEVHTMDLMAGMLAALMMHLSIEKVFMTGHSMGGYVTLAFADLFPELLSGFCLFHSQPFADSPETVQKRNNEIRLVEEGRKDQFCPVNIVRMFASSNIEKFAAAVSNSKNIASTVPGEALIAVLKGMIARPSRAAVMESGAIPCLWILGVRDNYIDFRAIQEKVRLPRNAEVAILENSGHMGFIEEEDKALEILGSFLLSKVFDGKF